MALTPGQIIENKYRIVSLLGEGGMGAVFAAENMRIHRNVAIKVLHAGVAEKADLVQRFEREAQAAGRIGSDHIVEILDLGILPEGDRFMVMEFLEGESLSDRIERLQRMQPAQIFPIMIELLEGLGAAHQAGIIHRDLKPDNVWLLREKAGRADFVKILDFGVSKFSPLANEEGMSMTQTGAVMGTPYYMSPEQAKGSRETDGRSDLFSVGVILYEAITGRVPFDGETFNELMFKIALQDPPPPEDLVPGLDPGVSSIMRKALARDPDQRFATAYLFSQAIQDWLANGTHVSVPPPDEVAFRASSPEMHVGAAAWRAPMPSAAGYVQGHIGTPVPGPGTPVPWAQTGAPGVSHAAMPPKKSNAGVVAGLAIALCAVVGGVGAFLVYGGGEASAPAGLTDAEELASDGETSAGSDQETSSGEAGDTDESAGDEDETDEGDPDETAEGEGGKGDGEDPAASSDPVSKADSPPESSKPPPSKPVATTKPPPKATSKPPPPPPPVEAGGRKIRTGLE